MGVSMNSCIVNDENLKLEITDKGLKKLLLNKGSEKVTSYISSVLDEMFVEFQSIPDIEEKQRNAEKFNKIIQVRMLHGEIFNDAKHPVITSRAKIKQWVSLLHELELPDIKKQQVFVCAKLWLDENADIDSKVLRDTCHSLTLLSTCFFCQNGNFFGNEDYSQARFINCLEGVAIKSETHERCTSFERRVTINEES